MNIFLIFRLFIFQMMSIMIENYVTETEKDEVTSNV